MKTKLKNYCACATAMMAIWAFTTTGRAAANDPYQALVTREFGTAAVEMAAVEKEIKNATKEQYPEIEAKLIAILENSAATMPGKQFACQMLYVVGSPKCIPAVSKLLTDEKLSHIARTVLQGMHDPAAENSLRQALEQTQGNLRIGIINTIGDRADRSSVRVVAALLKGNDNPTVGAALNALGKIGGTEAADALAAAKVPDALSLVWGDAFLRCATSLAAVDSDRSAKMCRYLFEGDARVPVSIRAGAFTTLARIEKEQAVPLIVKTLTSSDPKLRRVALGAIISIPGSAATKALAKEADRLAPEAKAILIGGLASRGDAEGVTPMVNKLAADENAIVRQAATKALAKLGNATSVPVLIGALKDKDMSAAASQALVDLRGPGVPEALIQQAQDGERQLRAAVLNILAERREPEALPVVRKALSDDQANIRRAALKTVSVLGTQEDLATLSEMAVNSKYSGERDDVVQAMSEVGGRISDKNGRLEPVLQAWSKADASTKARLLTVLWSLGGDKALQTVRSALEGDADMHKAAVKVLADWPDASPMPDLLNLAKNDKEASMQILALRGYIKMASQPGTRTEQRLQALQTAMELATQPNEKKLVLTGLADVARVDALKIVEPCLGDAALQREAYMAYEKIAESLASRQPAAAKEALQQVADKATDEGLRNKAKKALDKIK